MIATSQREPFTLSKWRASSLSTVNRQSPIVNFPPRPNASRSPLSKRRASSLSIVNRQSSIPRPVPTRLSFDQQGSSIPFTVTYSQFTIQNELPSQRLHFFILHTSYFIIHDWLQAAAERPIARSGVALTGCLAGGGDPAVRDRDSMMRALRRSHHSTCSCIPSVGRFIRPTKVSGMAR